MKNLIVLIRAQLTYAKLQLPQTMRSQVATV